MPVEILRLLVVHVPNVEGLIEINQGSQSASTYIMALETTVSDHLSYISNVICIFFC